MTAHQIDRFSLAGDTRPPAGAPDSIAAVHQEQDRAGVDFVASGQLIERRTR
jgi:hypothetical protein